MGCIRIYMFMGCIPTWYFWQGNHQIYGHIRRIYTLLAAPRCIVRFCCCAGTLGTTSQHLFSPLSCMSRMSGRGHSSWYVRARMPPALLLHFFLSWMNHWMSGQGHSSWYVHECHLHYFCTTFFLEWTIGWVGGAIDAMRMCWRRKWSQPCQPCRSTHSGSLKKAEKLRRQWKPLPTFNMQR